MVYGRRMHHEVKIDKSNSKSAASLSDYGEEYSKKITTDRMQRLFPFNSFPVGSTEIMGFIRILSDNHS